MPRGGRRLDRVILRVWESVQESRSQEEHELGTITLRLLGQIRTQGTATLDTATQAAFGCTFQTWRERDMGRRSAMAWELAVLIPDYDASNVTNILRMRKSS